MTDIREIVAKGIAQPFGFPEDWESYEPIAQAALQAIEQTGYAIVPVEPTGDMIVAGFHASEPLPDEGVTSFVSRAYKAMLTAYKEGK